MDTSTRSAAATSKQLVQCQGSTTDYLHSLTRASAMK